MVITAICEPRSGSTNLGLWFKHKENFTSFIEPLNTVSKDYKGYKNVIDWKYNTNHLFIKEVYIPEKPKKINELIEFSDKIIILYRENKYEQLESWLNACKTNNWTRNWNPVENSTNYQQVDVDHFNNIVNRFKENYFNNDNFLYISYEELYQSTNGIKKLIDFIGLEDLTCDNFPYGEKYRITKVVDKLI
jgi:hypothetical protein